MKIKGKEDKKGEGRRKKEVKTKEGRRNNKQETRNTQGATRMKQHE